MFLLLTYRYSCFMQHEGETLELDDFQMFYDELKTEADRNGIEDVPNVAEAKELFELMQSEYTAALSGQDSHPEIMEAFNSMEIDPTDELTKELTNDLTLNEKSD